MQAGIYTRFMQGNHLIMEHRQKFFLYFRKHVLQKKKNLMHFLETSKFYTYLKGNSLS